jgi:hypothetical protein
MCVCVCLHLQICLLEYVKNLEKFFFIYLEGTLYLWNIMSPHKAHMWGTSWNKGLMMSLAPHFRDVSHLGGGRPYRVYLCVYILQSLNQSILQNNIF